jgi:hypothetical protein
VTGAILAVVFLGVGPIVGIGAGVISVGFASIGRGLFLGGCFRLGCCRL